MANYGQGSAKRHVAWSNDSDFIEGIVRHGGFLSVADRQALQLSKLAHHYYDPKVGKIRYTGKSLLLPDSACPSCPSWLCKFETAHIVQWCFFSVGYQHISLHKTTISGSTLRNLVRRLPNFFGTVVMRQLDLRCSNKANCVSFHALAASLVLQLFAKRKLRPSSLAPKWLVRWIGGKATTSL